jgi:hypothetical protein
MSVPKSPATAAEIEVRLRRASRQYAFVATFMFGAIATLAVGILVVILLRGQALGATRVTRLAISWSPAIGYLWALWTLRDMFRALARDGLTFQPAVVRGLGRLGTALGIGAALSVMQGGVIYFLTRAWRTGGVVPGDSSPIMSVNVPALTLVVTSMALTVLAQMLARGARLEAETTRLKAALDDFI